MSVFGRFLCLAAAVAAMVLVWTPAAALAQNNPQSGPANSQTAAAPIAGANSQTGARQDQGPSDQAQTVSEDVYKAMFKALFAIFVLAVVLESALAVVFNWRPFLLYFDGRGVRTLVSLGFGWVIAALLKLDLVSELHAATAGASAYQVTGLGTFVTALVLAGGSSGVNNILKSLGFRDLRRNEAVAPKPPADKAWVAVRLLREEAAGRVKVLVATGPAGAPQLVGTIGGDHSPAPLFRWLLRDPTRFPTSSGYAVPAGQDCTIILEGDKKDGSPKSQTWGPYPLAPGAIVDIDIRL